MFDLRNRSRIRSKSNGSSFVVLLGTNEFSYNFESKKQIE
jgi:hypothetical protein